MSATQIRAGQIKSGTITNTQCTFGTPSASTDVAIKSYVDGIAQGLSAKPSAAAATVAALSPANTYSGGVLTATGNGVLTVDGYATVLNDYVLVKNEATGANNGLYKVTTAGTASVPYVLTRAVEMDASAEFTGAFVFVENGTVNASSGWVQTAIAPTVGSTSISFTQFSGAGEITAGNGLSKSANTLTIDTSITVDKTTSQTLTNKQLTSPGITTPTGIVKGDVGLGNVDNTSDASKPVSTAQQTALDLKANLISPSFTTPALGTPSAGVLTNCSGTAASLTAGHVTTNANLTGDVTSSGNATTIAVYQRSTVISGTQDGANKVFTIANTVKTGSEQVFINGQLLMPGSSNDYVYDGTTTVTFQAGFTAPASTDVLRVYGTY
jgi:hypothetical protein